MGILLALVLMSSASLQEGDPLPTPDPGAEPRPGLELSDKKLAISERLVGEVADLVRDYYDQRLADRPLRAMEGLGELSRKLLDAIPEGLAAEDSLANVEAWREILRRGFLDRKPRRLAATGRFTLKPMALPPPVKPQSRIAKRIYDGSLKVYYSVPKDFKEQLYPVVVVMHPQFEDQPMPLRDLLTSAQMCKTMLEWAKDSYPSKLLEKAIVVVPVLDHVEIDPESGLAYRPRWDSRTGVEWLFTAVREIILRGCPHDPSRFFWDGHQQAAAAALQLCQRFPSLQTGAILRGLLDEQADLTNCEGMAFLTTDAPLKELADRWAKEGYRFRHVEDLAAEQLLDWMQKNPKDYGPQTVTVRCSSMAYGAAYWLRIVELDRMLEGPVTLVGELNNKANEISVTASPGIRKFILYLNDNLLDLDKPIRVLVRAEQDAPGDWLFEGHCKRSLQEALDLNFDRTHGNAGELYVAHIMIERP
jgi:hypothetical protein